MLILTAAGPRTLPLWPSAALFPSRTVGCHLINVCVCSPTYYSVQLFPLRVFRGLFSSPLGHQGPNPITVCVCVGYSRLVPNYCLLLVFPQCQYLPASLNPYHVCEREREILTGLLIRTDTHTHTVAAQCDLSPFH